MSDRFLAFTPEAKAADVLHSLRNFAGDNRNISYLYIVAGEGKTLLGVVDLRDLVIAPENASLGELMISPVVTADQDCLREDLVALFAKYQFRMLPVVDAHDHLLGIVRYRDMLKGTKFELPSWIDLCHASKQHRTVRIALWALRIYLLILLSLIGLKFARVFSGSQKQDKAATSPPATATVKTNQTTVGTKP